MSSTTDITMNSIAFNLDGMQSVRAQKVYESVKPKNLGNPKVRNIEVKVKQGSKLPPLSQRQNNK